MDLARRGTGFDGSRRSVIARRLRVGWLTGLVSIVSWGVLAAPAAAQPTNDAPPTIAGSLLQGQPLTEVPGSWTGAAGAVTVQWESCPDSSGDGCTPIPNSPTAQGSQYSPTMGEVGEWITVVETASDGQGNVSNAIADPVGPVTIDLVTATMRWTFYYTPSYTKVLGLVLNGLAPQTTIQVGCRGHSCPFSSRISGPDATSGVLSLLPPFRRHRLHVGTQITVAVTLPGGIGKFYAFTVRAGRGPRIFISCLAPGATSPGASC